MGQGSPGAGVGCAGSCKPAEIKVIAGPCGRLAAPGRDPTAGGYVCIPTSVCSDVMPPPFAVPVDCDIYEDDAERTKIVVKKFIELLSPGATLRLQADDATSLLVKASLDVSVGKLVLTQGWLEVVIRLHKIRSIVLEDFKTSNIVVVELEGGTFCAFVFSNSEEGAKEAAFFGGCLQILSEGTRLDVVKAELLGLGSIPVATPPYSSQPGTSRSCKAIEIEKEFSGLALSSQALSSALEALAKEQAKVKTSESEAKA